MLRLLLAFLATLFLFSNAQTTLTSTDGYVMLQGPLFKSHNLSISSGSVIIQVITTNAAGAQITTAMLVLPCKRLVSII